MCMYIYIYIHTYTYKHRGCDTGSTCHAVLRSAAPRPLLLYNIYLLLIIITINNMINILNICIIIIAAFKLKKST